MKNFLRYTICLVLASLLACRKDAGKVNRGDYPDEIGKIIAGSCAVEGCHNSASAAGAADFNLESWSKMFAGANNGSPVIPYNSKFSSLCYFINTYPDLGLQVKPIMPLNSAPLSYEQVKLIKDWIDNGAPDINGNVMWDGNPARKKLYAANQGCDVVTVFDEQSMLPMRYIHVGNKAGANTPHQVRVSPDGKYWYVVFINTNVMQKFRCSDDSYVGDIPLTPVAAGTSANPGDDALNWNTFVITRDSRLAYSVSWPDGKVACVDLEKMKLVHFLGGQAVPHGIVLNAKEDKFYIAAQTGNFITEFDTAFSTSNEIILESTGKNTSSSLDPHDMILSPNGETILITCQKSNEVRVLNLTTGNVQQVIPTGGYPQEIVYSKGTNEYFVSCTEDTLSFPGGHGSVTRINATSYTASRIKCGFQPHGITVDESKKILYVLSRNTVSSGPAPHHTSQCLGRNGFVNFIDLKSFTVLNKRYELSVDPYFISARP